MSTETEPHAEAPATDDSADATTASTGSELREPTEPAPRPGATGQGRWAATIGLVLAAIVLVVDQLSKWWALENLSTTERIPLLGDAFGLQLAFNTGASLSLFADATIVISIVGIVVSVAIVGVLITTRSNLLAVGLGFVLGGALGNLVDRFLMPPGAGHGAVTDFLAYANWFIGNVADVLIGVGVVFVVLAALLPRRRGGIAPDPVPPTAAIESSATDPVDDAESGDADLDGDASADTDTDDDAKPSR